MSASEMTYIVSSGALNSTHYIPTYVFLLKGQVIVFVTTLHQRNNSKLTLIATNRVRNGRT